MELRELWLARSLSPDAFAARFGDGFLLLHGSADSLQPPSGPEKTGIIEVAAGRGELVPALDFVVYAVRNTGRSLFGSKIAVGRTANNDIHIEDRTVSKHHAVITRDPTGRVRINDAGSRAGTIVGGQCAPSVKDGPGLALAAGDDILLGSVQLLYLDLEGMLALLRGIEEASE